MRRVAWLSAVLLAVPLLGLPRPAGAAEPVPLESLWNLSDIRESAQYTPYTSLPPSRDNEIGDTWYDESNRDLSASADGSRVAYVMSRTGHQEVLLRDRSGQFPRVLWRWDVDPQWPPSSSVTLETPVLSPNGDRVSFWQQHGPWGQYGSSSECKAESVLPQFSDGSLAGCRPLAWLDETHLLVQTPGGWNQVRTGPYEYQPATALIGAPRGLDSVALGAGSTRIAWVVDGELSVGKLAPRPSGAWEVTEPRVLAPRVPLAEPGFVQVNVEPAFSRDGTDVLWVQREDPSGQGSIVSRPFDGSAPVTVVSAATSSRDHADVAPTWGDDVPPGPVVPGGVLLDGTRAAARWTPPSDSDLSGVLVTLVPPGGTPLQRYAPAGQLFYPLSGLRIGTTYDVDLQAVDRSGLTGPVSHQRFTALAGLSPIPRVVSSVSASTTFPVTLGTGGVAGATYDGAWRLGSSSTWHHWVQGSTASVQPLDTTPGTTIAISSRVHDTYGNTTGWRGLCCSVVPLDQTVAQFSGGTTSQRNGTWLGSVRTLRRPAEVARLTMSPARLRVIGSTCGSCGVMHVFVDGQWVKSVDTWSSVTFLRRTLLNMVVAPDGQHVVSLVPAGTSGRPDVVIDGFSLSDSLY